MVQTIKNLPAIQETPGFDPWVRKIPWRREWPLIPVFLPGEFRGQRSLEGYSPRGRIELDRTEPLTLSLSTMFGEVTWSLRRSGAAHTVATPPSTGLGSSRAAITTFTAPATAQVGERQALEVCFPVQLELTFPQDWITLKSRNCSLDSS